MFQSLIHGLIDFVQAHAEWAVPIAFVLSFLKALAFVTMVVPGITVMLAIGTLIGASGIDFVPVWLAVSLGAGLGDWVSYAIGFRIKDRARHVWPLSRHPDLLPRGERFFRRWGAMSVVLCRFFSPLRATIPLLCGIFEMPWGVFQLANWFSAFLWALVLLAPGSLLGGWFR
ncbi:DedA family protein [Limobrevibacterium gyesilva]|uniref:DedA family protein n=1 Tax=Limobrevibacterium gyesilva TaxID=2991712 RepID=A0AA42CCA5_9PROT|nr:DedA family protein [Limobrevibacterium gyesilva]MCW3472983.1 DedA family protein [Limobrevibacterium gyesilva]